MPCYPEDLLAHRWISEKYPQRDSTGAEPDNTPVLHPLLIIRPPGGFYSASSAVSVAPPICGSTADILTHLRESCATHMVIFSAPPSAEVISTR